MHYDYVFPSPLIKEPKSKFNRRPLILGALLSTTALFSFSLFLLLAKNSVNKNNSVAVPTPSLLGIEDEKMPSPTAFPSVFVFNPFAKKEKEDTEILKTKTLAAEAELDGFRTSNGRGNNVSEIKIGRNKEYVARGFLTFPTPDSFSANDVKSATLRIYRDTNQGDIKSLGKLLIDHLNYGTALDDTDFAMPALVANFTEIKDPPDSAIVEIDVTDQIKDDLSNARSYSQYRIHFEEEIRSDVGNGDFVFIESGEDFLNSGYPPQIIIKYN